MGLSDGDNNGVVTGGVGGGGIIGSNRGGGMETDSGADEIPRPMGKIRTGADRPDTVLSSQESFQGYYLTNLMPGFFCTFFGNKNQVNLAKP